MVAAWFMTTESDNKRVLLFSSLFIDNCLENLYLLVSLSIKNRLNPLFLVTIDFEINILQTLSLKNRSDSLNL